jgi:hypothetical protein
MEAVYSSEMSVTMYQPAWRHSLEVGNLHSHPRDILKSCQLGYGRLAFETVS